MKKFLCVLLSIVMLFSLAACVAEDTPAKETGKEGSTSTPEKKDDTFKLNETAVFKNLKVTATEIKSSNGDEFFAPAEGKTFVGIKFTIENISGETQNISSLLQFTAYADDIKCDYSFNAACAFDDGSLDGDLAPGKKMVGWYPVEVSTQWKSIEIDFISDILSDTPAKFIFSK